MSNSTSNSESNSFTEAKARDIMGKINDDLNTIALRGFTYLENNRSWWNSIREDLWFILQNQDLDKLQIQFRHSDEEYAVEYVIKSDYTIQTNRESGGVNYHRIPKDANIKIAIWRNNNPKVWEELQKRGWVSGAKIIEGTTTNKGAYSKDGYGAEIKLIGSWGK